MRLYLVVINATGEFIMRLSLFVLPILAVLTTACGPAQQEKADVIFLDGVIYTANSSQSIANALAIKGDQIIYVGNDKTAQTYQGKQTRVVDLQGKMVIPGLHDAHIHLAGIVETDSCDLASEPYTLDDLVPRLKKCIDRLQIPPGEWLTVDQWTYSLGNEPSDKYPTLRSALDAVSSEHPIALLGNDGHHGGFNSYAMSRATDREGNQVALNKQSLQTVYSHLTALVGVDADGEPNGAINEDARRVVGIPNLWGYPEINASLLERISQRLASLGITSVMDAALTAEHIEDFSRVAEVSPFNFRMTAAFFANFEAYRPALDKPIDVDALINKVIELRKKVANIKNFKVDTAKIFIDGVTEGNPYSTPPTLPNAAALENYLQPIFKLDKENLELSIEGYVDPHADACEKMSDVTTAEGKRKFKHNHGFLPVQCMQSNGVYEKDPQFMYDYILALHKAGINIHSHVIGDRAVRFALNAYAAASEISPDSPSIISLAHAQLVNPEDVERFHNLGIFIAFTYAWIEPEVTYLMTVSPFIDRIESKEDLFDSDGYAYKNSYPTASIKAAGGILTAGSDAPVDTRDPRPFYNIEKAVTRRNDVTGKVYNASERISVRDALDAYTINGAKMLAQDHITGSIEVGKQADLVVLDTDLLALESNGKASDISDTSVISTWFQGREIYTAK